MFFTNLKILFKKILILGCLLLMTVVFVETARGCSCSNSFETVDLAFARVRDVVVLQLISIQRVNKQQDGYGYEKIVFRVQRVFKGDLTVGNRVLFRQKRWVWNSGEWSRVWNSCEWSVDQSQINKKFLFYIGERNSKDYLYRFGYCSRSRLLEHSQKDLLYLEKGSQVRGKTRVSGTVTKLTKPAIEGERYLSEKRSGQRLKIVGKGRVTEVKTDENGVFEIYDLAPGQYKVFTDNIAGYERSLRSGVLSIEPKLGRKNYEMFKIAPAGHTIADITYVIKNQLSGQVIDSQGIALSGARIVLIPIGGKRSSYFHGTDFTDKEGRFEFKNMPEHSYKLGVNLAGNTASRQPPIDFYFPNSKVFENATTLVLVPGTKLNGIVIRKPKN